MAISKFLYFILLIVSILFYILYSETLSFYLLIFTVSLPFIMGGCIIAAKFLINSDIEPDSDTAIKNGRIGFSLKIRNRTPLPFPNTIVKVEYFNNLMGITDTMTISIPVHPLCSEKVSFALTSEYCGILNVSVKSVHIFDFIKLFSCNIKPKKSCEITVLPEIDSVSSAGSFSMINAEESDIFSKHKSGDDPSEIFTLKNYVPGDKPNRIHWNLSLKQDDLIVRHYSLPINSSILVILDFCGKASKEDIRVLDTAVQTAFSIAFYFAENDIPFKFAYYSSNTGNDIVIPVSDQKDITDAIKEIFLSGPAENTDFALNIKDISHEYSSILYITTSMDNLSDVMKESYMGNIRPFLIQDEPLSFGEQVNNEVTVISAGKSENGTIII